jgi:LysR family transcriptional regulator, glycine cleavage system transcriptional activator
VRPEALAREPLLGDKELWERWFAAAGLRIQVTPVAEFNDAGLMFQAAEQNLGLALGRELFAADALRDGRLIRVSPLSITHEEAHPFHLVYPPGLREWPPLIALRRWLREELEYSRKQLIPAAATGRKKASVRSTRSPRERSRR